MSVNFKAWAGQVTTGIGALISSGVLAGLASGQMTWQQAAPGIVAAIVGLAWPENTELKTQSGTLVQDVIAFVPLIATAIEHGKAAASQPASPASHVQGAAS